MRKLLALMFVLLVVAGSARADIVDSLGAWSYTNGGGLYAGGEIGSGQSFTCGTAVTLDSCFFYLTVAVGAPTGNIYAKIYSHTGTTYGTNSLPGDSLCVSDALDATSLSGIWVLETFTFSGANKISLSADYYVVVLYYNDGDVSNQVNVGLCNNTSAHDGNGVYTSNNITWTPSGSYDRIFYVYGTAESEGDTCCSTSGTLAFGGCDTNTTATDSFYIYNCGDSALVDSIDWTNLDEAFIPLSDSLYNIASGVTTWFSIQFDPPDVAAYADTIVLGHDSCGSIILSGTGTDPALPCCGVYTSPLAFGSVDTGSTDIDSFYIKNCGSITALEDSIDWAGLLSVFTPQNDSTYNIAAGDSQWFSIQFAPTAVTSYADTIGLGHDSCGSIIITGTGASGLYPSGDNVFYLAPPNPASGLRAGNDGYSGTHPDTAWATLQYADGQLSAGDTLFIMGGLYSNEQYYQGTVDGTAPSPIVIQAYGDSQAVFQKGHPEGAEYEEDYFINITTSDHLVFNGNNYSDASDTLCHIILQSGGYDGTSPNKNNIAIYCLGSGDGNGYSDSVTIYRVEVSGLYCGHDIVTEGPDSCAD